MGDLGLFLPVNATSPLELRVQDGKVEIIFQKPTKWVKLTPEQAEAIGQKMLEFSRLATGKIIVPVSTS